MWKKRFSLLLAPLAVLFSFAIVSIYRKDSAPELPLARLHLMDTMESDYSYFNSAYDGDRTYYDRNNNSTNAALVGFGNGEDMLGISGANGYNGYLKSLAAEGKTLPTVVIAVMDSGINLDHEIFAGRVMVAHGGSFVTGEYNDDISDSLGHGTHVAGVICDTTLPNVKVLPIKVFSKGSSIDPSKGIPKALNYIVELKNKGMNIVAVNMSFGTDPITPTQAIASGSSSYAEYRDWQFSVYQAYVDILTAAKILPIVAVGNYDVNKGGGSQYPSLPAACEGTVSVSAFDARDFENYDLNKNGDEDEGDGWWAYSAAEDPVWHDGWKDIDGDDIPDPDNASAIERAAFSNYGDAVYRSRVDIAAPGVDIWSARNSGTTELKLLRGTSQATPYVAAVYASIYSDPNINWAAENENRGEYLTGAARILMENAMPIGSGDNTEGDFGAGCVSLLSVPRNYSPTNPPAGKAKITAETSGGGMVSYWEDTVQTPIGEYIMVDNTADEFSVNVWAAGGHHILKIVVNDLEIYSYTDGDEKVFSRAQSIPLDPLKTDHTVVAEFSAFSADELRGAQNGVSIIPDDTDTTVDPRIWVGLMFVAGVVIVGVNLIKNRRKTAESEAEEIMRELREAQGGEDNGNY